MTTYRSTSRSARRLAAVLVALLCLVLAGCGTKANGSGSAGDGNGERRDLAFTSETVAGEPFDGATLEGTPTVLWFWAPWCPTCRGQIDDVSRLAQDRKGQVNVVGVGSLDDADAIREFAADVSPDVVLLDDTEGAVWRKYGVTAQSTYLVVDENGVETASGSLSEDELRGVVAKMLD